MKTIAQAKMTINGKHSIFHIFDWQGPDVEPAPWMEGHVHIITMSQAVGPTSVPIVLYALRIIPYNTAYYTYNTESIQRAISHDRFTRNNITST